MIRVFFIIFSIPSSTSVWSFLYTEVDDGIEKMMKKTRITNPCALNICWFHTSRCTILNCILHLKILYHDLITPKVLILFATVLESYSASLISNHLASKWYGQSLSHYLNEIFSLYKFLMLKTNDKYFLQLFYLQNSVNLSQKFIGFSSIL